MTQMLPDVQSGTSQLRLRESADWVDFDQWRHSLSRAFVPLDVSAGSSAQQFRGSIQTRVLGELRLTDVRGDQAQVRRTASTIRQSDPGHVKVAMQLRGRSTITQGGQRADLSAGLLTVYRTSQQYELNLSDPFEMLVAVVPRVLLQVSDRELSDASAHTVGTGDGVGALLKPLLCSLATVSSAATLSQHLVHAALTDLLSASIRDSSPQVGAISSEAILVSARSYIQANLYDPSLTPTAVAAHHNVSIRYLQKLFASEDESIAEFIRQRRLELCRRELADPTQAHRSIAQICASYGIYDAPHFSRLFKKYFGLSPREYRDGCRPTLGIA